MYPVYSTAITEDETRVSNQFDCLHSIPFISNFWSFSALNCVFICSKQIRVVGKSSESPLFCYSSRSHLFLIISGLSVGNVCLLRLIGDYYRIVDRFGFSSQIHLLSIPLFVGFFIPNSGLLLLTIAYYCLTETWHRLQRSDVSVTQYEILLS